jgi:hypothetical protein
LSAQHAANKKEFDERSRQIITSTGAAHRGIDGGGVFKVEAQSPHAQ